MDTLIQHAFENGALNNIILSVALLWIMHFITNSFWPNYVERSNRQQELNHSISEKKIDADTEIKKLEIQAQIEVYKKVMEDMKDIKTTIEGVHATFSEFLQNVLSQFMEDRRDLIDTKILRREDKEQ